MEQAITIIRQIERYLDLSESNIRSGWPYGDVAVYLILARVKIDQLLPVVAEMHEAELSRPE